MGQKAFYRENRKDREEREILLTERLCQEETAIFWRLRAMSQKENEEIWRRCGEDETRYEQAVLAASIVFPDLRDIALQNSYGTAGAERLLARMLLPGEYERLRQAVEEINGGDAECTDFI